MSNRWYIFKDGRALGPYEAVEIRELLRDGSIDPFDQVARDGGGVRRDLVEVDEIFNNSKVIYGGESHEHFEYPRATAFAPEIGTNDGTRPRAAGTAEALDAARDGDAPAAAGGYIPDALREGARGGVAGNGQLLLADPSVDNESYTPSYGMGPGAGNYRRKRLDPKSYELIDARGRLLGPLSASEIQALFYRGVLERSVAVMKRGSSARVPVGKFVAVYAQTIRRPRLGQGAHPALQGGLRIGITRRAALQRAMLQRAMARSGLSGASVLAICLGVILAGLATIIFYKNRHVATALVQGRTAITEPLRGAAERRQKAPMSEKKPAKKRRLDELRETPADVRQLSRPPAAASMRRAPRREQSAAVPGNERRELEVQRRSEGRIAELRRQRDQATQRNRSRLAELRRKEDEQRRRKVQRDIAVRAAMPRAARPQAPVAAVRPAAVAAKPAGPGIASLTNGQTVTRLGPLRYATGAIAACEAACSVRFSGAGGAVTVKFFKAAWGSALIGKGGSAYISGTVRQSGGGTIIMLSDVQ